MFGDSLDYFRAIPKELLVTSFITVFFANSRMEFLGWWFHPYFSCSPRTLGKMNTNWTVAYFSDGLVKNHQADFGCPEPDFQGGHCHCHGNLAGERPESASLLREPHVWKHPKHPRPDLYITQKTSMELKKMVVSRCFSFFPSKYFLVPC